MPAGRCQRRWINLWDRASVSAISAKWDVDRQFIRMVRPLDAIVATRSERALNGKPPHGRAAWETEWLYSGNEAPPARPYARRPANRGAVPTRTCRAPRGRGGAGRTAADHPDRRVHRAHPGGGAGGAG